MNPRLEHANLVVQDVDAIIQFVQTALPEFYVRHTGANAAGVRWVHVGTDATYIALSEASEESTERWKPYSGKAGLNHLGFEVTDAGAVQTRLREAGYQESTIQNDHPHRSRVYFHDPEGNDWEFVQYLSDKTHERNDYDN